MKRALSIPSDWKTDVVLANGKPAYDLNKVGDNWISFNDLYDAFKRAGNTDSKTKFGMMLNDFSVSYEKKVNKKNIQIRIGIKKFDEVD